MPETQTQLTDEETRQLRDDFERTARCLQFVVNERTRSVRLIELHELLCQLNDHGLATDRDAELYGRFERW